MKLPMFSSYLYDDRTFLQIVSSELELLLYIKSLEPALFKKIFKALEQENWHLTIEGGNLISIIVSALLNEEIEEGCDFFYVPITDRMAIRLLEYDTADFRDFFIGDDLQYCFDWLVSAFFYDFEPKGYDNTLYSTFCNWYDIDHNGEERIKEFDRPFSDFIKSEIIQFDEKKNCYFLKMDFEYTSPEMIGEAFFNVYDFDYLFKIGVLKREEEYEKNS